MTMAADEFKNVPCKILITGGAGFIASALAHRLVQAEENFVVIVDSMLTGSKKNLPGCTYKNWHFIYADVNKYEEMSAIMVLYHFDYVFHYAATVGVQFTLSHPVMVLNDIQGIRNILDLSKNTGVKCVYYSSSSEVYGEPVEFPQNEETTALNSRLPYAVVKNVGESFLKSYHKEYGLNYVIFRFFNTYGPMQSHDFVVSKFMRAALQQKDIMINGDGKQTRTFLYIDDNVAATTNEFNYQKYTNQIVNIGSDIETTILELAERIISLTKSKSKIYHLPPLPEGDMMRRRPDVSKMKQLLNRELIPLDQGLHQILNSWSS
ncbi:MAG: NAD-dependent epimerase/dehydratase family protein [Chitinophagales bacterium]|nr:NAD-dependent epimerase/dehydratase family protein [Chitinophagales bacterium]